MRTLACAITIVVTACGPPTPGPVVQRLVDEYAPGLPIGERLPLATRGHYKLGIAAYQGYAASNFNGPDGVDDLVILMDPTPGDGIDEKIPAYATIAGVKLTVTSPDIVSRVDARIRAAMGAPRIACYRDGFGQKVETRFWPAEHGRGVLLVISNALPAAEVTFGAHAVSPEHVKFESCV
ncbi:MAG TPA: hypothetical protein VKB50_16920 [Vicinamibacterales bacterium]|nr:hypothetical protein [Vicinamibacterales bacterium]